MNWDFLKGILPDSMFKYIDNRTIITIKDNKIICGKHTISDPNLINKFFNAYKSYQPRESLPTQVIHKDLVSPYLDYENIAIEGKESLSILKKVLPSEEIECIIMARRIHLAYRKNNRVLAEDLLKQLDNHYPKKGRKVANLIRAGYFDSLIVPMIGICRNQHGQNYAQKFQEFYLR